VAGVCFQALGHHSQHGAEGLDGDFPLGVQDLHEPRHVSAFEVVRQAHIHVEGRNRMLLTRRTITHPHGMHDVLDPDAIDGQAARIGASLDVLDFSHDGAGDLGGYGRGHFRSLPQCRTGL
jgi:hypothetical protein